MTVTNNTAIAVQRLHESYTTNHKGCKLTQRSPLTKSYVQVEVRGELDYAHRWAWRAKYGDIPKGMLVCHECDEPRCFNVEHLFLGTHQDNSLDMVLKGRQHRGEKHHNARYAFEDIVTLRDWWDEGRYDIDELAYMFDMSEENVESIVKRESWKFYSDPDDKNTRPVMEREKSRYVRPATKQTLSKQDILAIVTFEGSADEACEMLNISHKQWRYVRSHYNDEGKLDYRKNLDVLSYE